MSSTHTLDLPATEIAQQCLHDPENFNIQFRQTEHRIALVSKWPIFPGAKILEIGCGQGDCTAVLAEAVGPGGHVTAVDPAESNQGSPYTFHQAQSHLSSGKYMSRISWVRADPIKFLSSNSKHPSLLSEGSKYDVAVLVHCLWYFTSPQLILDTLRLLAIRAHAVCIAEWSLSAGLLGPSATPHVLAALTQGALQSHRPAPRSNIRTVISPSRIKSLATQAGLLTKNEGIVTPDEGVLDGKWEVDRVMSARFLKEIDEVVKDQRAREVVLALRDAVEASLVAIGGRGHVWPMTVWWATLEPTVESE